MHIIFNEQKIPQNFIASGSPVGGGHSWNYDALGNGSKNLILFDI